MCVTFARGFFIFTTKLTKAAYFSKILFGLCLHIVYGGELKSDSFYGLTAMKNGHFFPKLVGGQTYAHGHDNTIHLS
jgi:hypothetical protein